MTTSIEAISPGWPNEFGCARRRDSAPRSGGMKQAVYCIRNERCNPRRCECLERCGDPPSLRHVAGRFRQQFAGDPAAFGENQLEDRDKCIVIERAGVETLNVAEDVVFARFVTHGQAGLFLELAELNRHLGPAIEQTNEFAVQFVDASSMVTECHSTSPFARYPAQRQARPVVRKQRSQKKAANPFRGLRPISVNFVCACCYMLESPARMRFTEAATP